jgi:hypothetical protein
LVTVIREINLAALLTFIIENYNSAFFPAPALSKIHINRLAYHISAENLVTLFRCNYRTNPAAFNVSVSGHNEAGLVRVTMGLSCFTGSMQNPQSQIDSAALCT